MHAQLRRVQNMQVSNMATTDPKSMMKDAQSRQQPASHKIISYLFSKSHSPRGVACRERRQWQEIGTTCTSKVNGDPDLE